MPTIRISAPKAAETSSTPHVLVWSKSAQSSIKSILSRYPAERSRSALIPLLHLAQREFGGWLSTEAMQLVADTLDLPYIRVYEVASFYTMFNLNPVGKHHIQVCTNCACMVRGSDEIVRVVKEFTGLQASGQTTEDGLFTFTEVECLGACVNAPMMQVAGAEGSSHYFTDLDAKKTKQVLESLKKKASPAKFIDTPPAAVDPITHAEYGK